ncbi:SGNH/GDSL hydrolase family protein [Ruania halotolerans]|uniref:SGNH/GDSL hydrolase family protein n=1 Tax=Ruania halotolerans TaxID=2897773 RepID=UPI001E458707|nr:SGNH/GDSL hydrolase family protein [Ruania halotolerans]UFU07213.1 SGNH/GDSL hydrolase family protein [Ruania halotolerans]
MSATKPVIPTRYVAIGDSMTEGLWDEDPHAPGALRGWADRFAAGVTARRYEDGLEPLEYANLAIRGRLLGPILTEQLPLALSAAPDLVSIVGGGNDLLRPGSDPDRLAVELDRAVRTARAEGAQVLLATGTDTRNAGLLRRIRPKVAIYNAHIWSIANRYGAHVLDIWGLHPLQDWRMWAEDRIHLSSLGHARVADAALVALGLDPEDRAWQVPLGRAPATPATQQLRSDAAWVARDVYPWAARRLRKRSSGDERAPKRPELLPVTFPGSSPTPSHNSDA